MECENISLTKNVYLLPNMGRVYLGSGQELVNLSLVSLVLLGRVDDLVHVDKAHVQDVGLLLIAIQQFILGLQQHLVCQPT